MGTSKRERQKSARHEKIEELRRMEQKQATRRRGVLIGAAIAAFLAFAIGYSVLTADDDGDDVAETVAAAPECPPTDGSAERTIDFTGPFEDCLTAGVDYQARFTTTEGEILVDLQEDEMPNTVNNFVALARYRYYDDTLVFRTDPSIDIIQGGSPHTQDNRDPGPGYQIPDEGGTFEVDEASGRFTGPFRYEEGQLMMARSSRPDSSSAQFFMSTGPKVEFLDTEGTYLLFGDVLEGLDVLQAIMDLHEDQPENRLGGAPSREVTIESVEILEL